MIENEEFIQEFVDEARGHVEKVETLMLGKEGMGDFDVINNVFRAMHSIKGTAGFFGLKNIVSIAHTMENIFDEVRSGNIALDDQKIDVLLKGNDYVKDMIEDVLNSEEVDLSEILRSLKNILEEHKDADSFIEEESINGNESKQDEKLEDSQKEDNSSFGDLKEQIPNLAFEGEDSDLVKKNLLHGHSLFHVRVTNDKRNIESFDALVKFFENLSTLGTIVDVYVDGEKYSNLKDAIYRVEEKKYDVVIEVLITTVLEVDLLTGAIGVPKSDIVFVKENIKCKNIKSSNKKAQKEPLTKDKDGSNQNANKASSVSSDDNVRVNVSILNDLMDMASEMVLARNQLLSSLEKHRKDIPGLVPILQNVDILTSGMQEKIMQTRMQPLGKVFNKFPRIIRDISKNLSKEIELIIEGEGVELDKSIIEGLADPLTHLIRNSADHGLENPDERELFGKARTGMIKLKAYHEGGFVNVDVVDDGKGIDAHKIKDIALEKGVITQRELESMNEQEILKLIFKPGFSTAEKITDVSGRGVGMDVVKTNIEQLGGTVEVFSAQGAGTTMRLILPLTLAILQALVVESEGYRFSVPQVNVKEIVKIKKGDETRKIELVNDAEVLRLRGHLLPIIRLSDALGIKRTYIDPLTGKEKLDRRKHLIDVRTTNNEDEDKDNCRKEEQSVLRILVIKSGSRSIGLAVDSVLGSEEILVKPLPTFLKECICYSGVTIMGDGRTAMILDAEGMIKISNLKFIDQEINEIMDNEADLSKMAESQNLLIFKSAGNEVFAVDLAMIARVEEIKRTDIEKLGEQEYIQRRGETLRVIRPEEYVSGNEVDSSSQKLYVLIPKLVRHPIGILANEILDNVNITLRLEPKNVKVDCLVGSAIHNDNIVLVLNIYELFEKADPLNYSKDKRELASKKRLLLVEDTPFFQRMAKRYLENAGYEVSLSKNGKEAFENLKNATFDAVVSDIQMPVMDGFGLVKRIRQTDELKNIPVIALTSMTGDYNKTIGIESGFDYYEYKLDRDKLLNTVEKALEESKFIAIEREEG